MTHLRILILALSLTAVSLPSAQAGRPVKIKIGTLVPRGSSFHKSLMEMADEWKHISDGNVRVTIYPDGAQGSERDMVRLMKLGTLQGGALTSMGLVDIAPDVAGLQGMPMLYSSLEEYDYIRDHMAPELEKDIEDKGYIMIFWSDSGWNRFFSVKRFTTPDELKKMPMFVWAGDPERASVVKNAGFKGVTLESSELLTALQTGMVEVSDMPPIFALATQVDRKANYMLNLNYAPLIGGLVIRKDTWESIPADQRKEMLASARKIGAQLNQASRKENLDSIEAMKHRGLNVVDITEEELAQWRHVMEKDVYPLLLKKLVPMDMYKRVQELSKEFKARK